MDETEIAKKRMLINMEIQLRCGDGGIPNTITHSINCNCEELNARLVELSDIQGTND